MPQGIEKKSAVREKIASFLAMTASFLAMTASFLAMTASFFAMTACFWAKKRVFTEGVSNQCTSSFQKKAVIANAAQRSEAIFSLTPEHLSFAHARILSLPQGLEKESAVREKIASFLAMTAYFWAENRVFTEGVSNQRTSSFLKQVAFVDVVY